MKLSRGEHIIVNCNILAPSHKRLRNLSGIPDGKRMPETINDTASLGSLIL